jgi:hypothetical protein
LDPTLAHPQVVGQFEISIGLEYGPRGFLIVKAPAIVVLAFLALGVGIGTQRWLDSRKPAIAPVLAVAESPAPKPDLCEHVPDKFQQLGERLAWFYGCIHRVPPTADETKAAVAALSPDKREKLKGLDLTNQEALIGVANGDLPIGVFPK